MYRIEKFVRYSIKSSAAIQATRSSTSEMRRRERAWTASTSSSVAVVSSVTNECRQAGVFMNGTDQLFA